jgi:putative transposase
VVSAQARREVVGVLCAHKLSQRRSCELANISRTSVGYEARPRSDLELQDQLRAIAARHPRYGYRRAHALLARDDQRINHKRVFRLWRNLGLSLPRRRPRRRSQAQPRVGAPQTASRPNEVWTYDFVHDWCANGERLKMLTIVDEFTRESLRVETRSSIKSKAVVAILDRVMRERGVPAYLRSDNDPELVAHRVKEWLAAKGTQTLYIEPGSPWQNARGESFHGRLRDECLNMEWFHNLREARVVTERWRRFYNEERPHSSLGYRTPVEFRQDYEQQQVEPETMRL